MNHKPLIDRNKVERENSQTQQNFYYYQYAQRDHDMIYHRDIFFMDHADRFKHVILHYTKYARRLANFILDEKDKSFWKEIEKRRQTMVDSFIMTLNLMEIFNINFKDDNVGSLPNLQDHIAKKQPELYDHLSHSVSHDESTMRFLLEYVKISGFLAKVAEELDHLFMEINRKQVEEEIIKMIKLHLLIGKIWSVEYWYQVPRRWSEIEEKRIV